MGRFTAGALVIISLAGCGNWSRVGSETKPGPEPTLNQLVDLSGIYRKLGRLATGEPLPFVASVSFLAGSHDSTLAVVALSLENRALTFQRESTEFVAKYRVEIAAAPASGPPVLLGSDELIRVGSFRETQRADESILFQKTLRLAPGPHRFAVALRDRGSNNQSRADGDVMVPGFTVGSTSAPVLVYQARGRTALDEPPAVIVSPRGTVAYGGDTVLVYLEGYRMPGPTTVPFELRNEQDSILLRDTVRFTGGHEVESAVVHFAPDSTPLGVLTMQTGTGAGAQTGKLLVSVSQAWLATNFDDMLSLLRYFPEGLYLDSLRKAKPEDRPALWRRFWLASDPNRTTPENEALDEYFSRLGMANQRFRDEGVPGWRTDRGEVFIGLGEADEVFDASPASQGRIIRWAYTQYRLVLYFQDETGFGRFRLTPGSRAEYERILSRVRSQAQ